MTGDALNDLQRALVERVRRRTLEDAAERFEELFLAEIDDNELPINLVSAEHAVRYLERARAFGRPLIAAGPDGSVGLTWVRNADRWCIEFNDLNCETWVAFKSKNLDGSFAMPIAEDPPLPFAIFDG